MSPILTIQQLPTPETIIVAGSGRKFYDEFYAATELAPLAHVLAVNFTACFIAAPLHHLASLHYQEVDAFRRARACLDFCYGYEPPVTHSNHAHDGVDRVWPEFDNEEGRQGTSSLFAVKVALALGYKRVILAGVPMDATGRFYDPPIIPERSRWKYDAAPLRKPWERMARELPPGTVTSMGGWTAQVFGRP